MPLVTYLSNDQTEKMMSVPTDPDLDELLQDVRRITDEDWLIGTREDCIRHWFKETEIRYHYTLFVCVGGIEYQVINLKGSNSQDQITNYLLGYIAGFKKK